MTRCLPLCYDGWSNGINGSTDSGHLPKMIDDNEQKRNMVVETPQSGASSGTKERKSSIT